MYTQPAIPTKTEHQKA